jgi:hypothetical protein
MPVFNPFIAQGTATSTDIAQRQFVFKGTYQVSKTNLRNVQGWTPVIDTIIENHGLTTALVFGVIWRYCQMDGHTCYASQETLAKSVCVTRQTINTHADILVKEGYLEKVEHDGHPSVYKDTGKAGLIIEAYDNGGVNLVDTSMSRGVNEIDTRCKANIQGVSTPFTGGVNLVDTNKTINTPIKKQRNKTKAPDGAAPKINYYPIARALSKVTGLDFEKNKSRLFGEAKKFKPEEEAQIIRDYSSTGSWYSCDWRGMKGQPPSLSQVRETWGNLKPPITQKSGNGHIPPVEEDPNERAKIDAAFAKG